MRQKPVKESVTNYYKSPLVIWSEWWHLSIKLYVHVYVYVQSINVCKTYILCMPGISHDIEF